MPARFEALPQRLNLVTLGVGDVRRARAFYQRLGFAPAAFDSDEVAFFEMGGAVLALFGREPLAEDANVASQGHGFKAQACAINLESEAAVDEALAFVQACGGLITQPARKVFWGGYSGYFADPDGHLWEIAYNPVFPLGDDGRLLLPPPGETPATGDKT
ncbi:MAG: VOC family protein [Hyphomicrobiaceae bacterium]|nr:VOC family protein [Hyphomicrobiaceae bacterium]